jgi:mannose-6-phosphate isomerase-like protein (cupin superfamily)
MSLPAFKRVITGHDHDGRAVVVESAAPPHVFASQTVPGTVFHEIWRTDATPVPIDNGTDPTSGPLRLPPPPLGSAVRIVDIPPDGDPAALSAEHMAAHFAEMGGAQLGSGGSRHPLMHRTQTLDYGVVLAGEVWMVLDNDEIRLSAGDVVVQRGTNHAWSNRSGEMARMLFVLLDGSFALATV